MVDLDRIKDPQLLRQIARLQHDELERVLAKLREARIELASLQGRSPEEAQTELAGLEVELSRTFSSVTNPGKSERRPRRDGADKPRKKREKFGRTPQPNLPIEEVVHDLDEADKACPDCGEVLVPWEGQDEASEAVSVTGVQYVLQRNIRKKYRCRCGGAIETAAAPPRLSEGGRYSDAFIVHTAVQKYDAHIPLNRQVRLARRAGLEVTTQTLWKQTLLLADVFAPALERLHAYLLTQEVLFADESRWPVLGSKDAKSRNWTAWVLVGEDAVRHFIEDTRGLEAGAEILRGFQGVLTTDGYQVYKSLAASEGFLHAHCWAHARRYLIAAEDTQPELSAELLDLVGQLFGIERALEEETSHLPKSERHARIRQTRQASSKPIVAELGKQLMGIRALPKSPMAAAVRYFENQWKGLKTFLDHPQVPLTSNAAERSLRGLVLGRHNHVGSRSELGTEVAADLYSLVETAKLNQLDPAAYLNAALGFHHQGRTIPLPHELKRSVDPDTVEYPARPPPKPDTQPDLPIE